jgi:hypothetical protein
MRYSLGKPNNPSFQMNTNIITKSLIAAVVVGAGIFGLSQVETNLPLVSIAVSYIAVAAIFGLAAGDYSTNRKRLS